jgi:hypothetical protein
MTSTSISADAAAEPFPLPRPDGCPFDPASEFTRLLTEQPIAIRTIFARIPTLRLAVPVEELPFKNDRALYGVHALPVSWEPDGIRPRATTGQD